MAKASQPTPPPAAKAISKSRMRRARAVNSVDNTGMRKFLSRLGSHRKPSKMSTVVTTSTTNCVRAKSGAENHKNVMQVHRPAPPSMIRAAIRWYLAFHAAPRAHRPPTVHSKMKAGDKGKLARLPSSRPRIHSGNTPAPSATKTSHSICHCRCCVLSRRRVSRASSVRRAITFSKMRLPSSLNKSGTPSLSTPCLRNQCKAVYKTMPPIKATTLMINGVLIPCHTAKLK